jgi:very-short-patch-repair endonuclease
VDVASVLGRQAGVISTAQAVAAGLSARTVRRRVQSGGWEELHPGVHLVRGHRSTPEARIRAAWLWAGGERATVTGPAAAFWHRMLDRAPRTVEITVPRATHLRSQPGIVLRRRDLDARDRVETDRLWVAEKPLAALATTLHEGSTFLDRALQRHVTLAALQRTHHRNLGGRGSRELGRLLAAAAGGGESEAERLLVRLLRRAGATGWVLGHPFGPYRLDLAFPAQRVAVEVDGWAFHSDVTRFQADRRKGNAITRRGWDLLRYTWHDLDRRPSECVHEIVETVA